MWEGATRRALEQIELQADCRALDAGCGAGEAMRLIAARMDYRGSVVGMDVDAPLLQDVAPRLQAERPGVYSFVAADLTQSAVAKDGEFDLVFARLLLFHLEQPLQALRRLWARVRPGGVLLVMDYDLTSARSVPPHAAIERALRLVTGALRRADREIDIGTSMPARFIEAGIGAPDHCEINSLVLAADSGTAMLREVLNSLQPLILRAQLADAAALDQVEAALLQAPRNDQFVRWPDLVTTWKRKPG